MLKITSPPLPHPRYRRGAYHVGSKSKTSEARKRKEQRKTSTRKTEKSKSLIDVALTTKENIIYACDVMQSAIIDHSLVSLTLKLKTPRPRISFVTTRSYKKL